MYWRIINCIACMGLAASCGGNINKYYAGIVIDESGRLLENVTVKENSTLNPLATKTDKNGRFILNRNESIICNLIIEKEGYRPDTIETFNAVAGAENMEDVKTEYTTFLTSDTGKVILQKLKN